MIARLIIDPSLFEIDSNVSKKDEFEHFMFLKSSVDFVADYFESILDNYDGAPYIGNYDSSQYYPPITRSLTIRNRYSQISKKIQKMASKGKWIDLQEKLLDTCSLQFVDNSIVETKFKQYLYVVSCDILQENTILLLSQKNNNCTPTVSFCANGNKYILSTVFNPAEDVSGIVHKYLKPSSNIDSIFPQQAACSKLNDKFKEEISEKGKTVEQRKAIYSSFGTEVAYRNMYYSKVDISRKNPGYEVFVHEVGKYFLSIDKEHGALEVFKKRGSHTVHLGEFDFSCTKTKEAEPQTHKLVI